jgi:Tfp pilus assembly pilus retraction ATPase PilT
MSDPVLIAVIGAAGSVIASTVAALIQLANRPKNKK